MSTFFDPTADATEASEALRGLAHASRTFDQPAQMYGVIGDLSAGMRSLHQVLEQLADVHERKAAHAFNDDGNHAAGVRDALATAEKLRRSGRLVDQAYDRLAEGFAAAGRIAWHPELTIDEPLNGSVAFQRVAFRGTANTGELHQYVIELKGPQTIDVWAPISQEPRPQPVVNGDLGQADLSQWAAGPYLVQLRALDAAGGQLGVCTIQITLDN